MILQLPAAAAVTNPVLGLTVANAVLELDQVPPVFPFAVNVLVVPVQSGLVPEILPAEALGLMVIDFVEETGPLQPAVTV
jgi:hypothetical protein